MKKYDLTNKNIVDDLKWLENPNSTLNDFGDLIRYLLNEVEELKLKLNKNMNELSKEEGLVEKSNDRVIYGENLNGDRYKMEIDSEGNQMIQKVESLEESLYRLIRDDVVVEQSRYIDECTGDEVMEIVLNYGILTDEYYSELMDVLNVINKQWGMHFTVKIKY